MSKARYPPADARKRHSRFAKSDDDVSFRRDVREKRPKKLEGAGHPATPSGPPLTNTLQAPRRDPPQE